MLTAAVVRDEKIRAAFEVIVWINMSQEPDLLQLQQLAYSQLTGGDSLPQKSRETTKTQLMQLEKKAKGRVVLLVLDGNYFTMCGCFVHELIWCFRYVGRYSRKSICLHR